MTIYQGDETLCGWAATRMLLVRLTHCRAYARMALNGPGPHSLEALEKAAHKAGVRLLFRRVDDPRALFANREFPILLLLNGRKNGHLVLARRRVGNRFLIDDPARGRRWVRIDELIKSWSLIYGEGEPIEKEGVRPRGKKPLLRPPFKRGLLFAELAAALGFAFGLFFLNEGGLLEGGFLLLGATLLLVMASLLAVLALKDLDRRYDPLLASLPDERFKRGFEAFARLKKGAVGDYSAFLTSSFGGLFLLLLLGLGSPGFLLAGGLLALYLVLEGTFGGRKLGEKARLLAQREEGLFRPSISFEGRLRTMKEIEASSYKILASVLYGRIVSVLLSFLLALLPTLLSAEPTFLAYLLNALALFSLNWSFRGAGNYLSGSPVRRSDLDYFDQYIDPLFFP